MRLKRRSTASGTTPPFAANNRIHARCFQAEIPQRPIRQLFELDADYVK
jgi:hypothetical protein